MLVWALIVGLFAAASFAVAMQLRNQRAEIRGLNEKLHQMQDALLNATREMPAIEACQGEDILDSIENDDYRMANNLGRLNILLDQLNGLLQGGRDVDPTDRGPVYLDNELPIPLPGGMEFEGPGEFEKFSDMPPITEDEIASMDWELLFKRLQGEDFG